LYIQAIADGPLSTTWTTMNGIKPYSKHKIEVMDWRPDLTKKPDLVFYYFGALINEHEKMVIEHREVKWVVGIRGPSNFGKLGYGKHFKFIDGFLVSSNLYVKLTKERFNVDCVYETGVGVDIKKFLRSPPPKYFSVGWAESVPIYPDSSDFTRFLSYPYPKKTSAEGIGTFRSFESMPEFYREISVLVDPVTWIRPGGLMFLESASTGRPVICMKSGVLAEWLPEKWLAKNDSEVIDMLTKLQDKVIYEEASDLYYNIAKSRDFSVVVKEYDLAFDKILEEPTKN
jgi:hypothetical protein